MCYMTEPRVGIRELRQNLSVYVERVKAGETLEVTDRGQPVAILAPLPEPTSTLERLRREGRLRPATGSLDDLPPPLKVNDPDINTRIREALEESRGDTV